MGNDVIFICHGNVNRSRAAETILRFLRPDLSVDSFAVGIKAKPGAKFSKKMREVLIRNGYEETVDEDKRSQVLGRDSISEAEHVFIMDTSNMKYLYKRLGLQATEKVKYLGKFIGQLEIKDPGFSQGTEDYVRAFEEIEECCIKLSSAI